MTQITVLLIDDDKDYVPLIKKMLSPDVNRYHVEWAISAKVAIEMATQTDYDVYLVDYNLGASNGLDLVREMIAIGINAPLILMTAYTEYNFDQKVIEAGASDYIDKTDLKPSILKRTIRYSLQRKQDLKALRASEESYRTLMADASDGIILMNPEGQILVANAKASELLNRPLESLSDQPTAAALQLVKPDQIAYNSFELDETRLFEHVIHHNGDKRFVEISAKQITGQRLQIIMRDITHRKRIEAERERYIERLTILQQIDDELTQLLDVNHVLAIAVDATIRLSFASAGFIGTLEGEQIRIGHLIGRYQGLRRGDYLPNAPLIMQAITDQQARFIQDVTTTPDYVAMIQDTHSQFVIPLTSYKRVLGVLVLETPKPERFTEDAFDFIRLIASRVAVAIENAQLYQLAQEQLAKLTKLYEQVSDLEKLKTDMIRIAAHDLRNPVGVITGYIELLEWSFAEGALTKKQRDHINAIMRAAQRMQKITSDILSLERIEKLHLEKANRIELNDLVQQAFNDFDSQGQEKHQHLQLNITERLLEVLADSAQIREAIGNLISNAIKYTPENGKIEVSLEYDEDNAIFRVRDNGYGIPLEQQAGLFQPFYRATTAKTIDIEGTGLGLHLVKNIIQRYDGEMIFSSVEGEGSTFGFKLPLI